MNLIVSSIPFVEASIWLGQRALYLSLWISHKLLEGVSSLGRASLFLLKVLHGGIPARRTHLVFKSAAISYLSRSIISSTIASLSVGMLLSLQSYRILGHIGSHMAERFLSQTLVTAMVKEFGPILTALLFITQVGTALTSEIGLMKSSEQLASLEMMAIDPIRRVFVPKFWAVVVALPFIALHFCFFGLLGGGIMAVSVLGVDSGFFLSGMGGIKPIAVKALYCFVKSTVFGFLIAWISLFSGYDAKPSPDGISQATTRGGVVAVLLTLATNFLFTLTLGEVGES